MSEHVLIAAFLCGASVGVAVIIGLGVLMELRRRPKVPAFLREQFAGGEDV